MNWLAKILEFKDTCRAGNVMTEAQARILRGALYRYEAIRKNAESPGCFTHMAAYDSDRQTIEENVLCSGKPVDPLVTRMEELQRELAEVTSLLKERK
jgi:hypothetical protein